MLETELFKLFYAEIKDEYDLTENEVKEIYQNAWRETRRGMESPGLPPIRQKYFGIFSVRPNRLKLGLANINRRGVNDSNRELKKTIEDYVRNQECK